MRRVSLLALAILACSERRESPPPPPTVAAEAASSAPAATPAPTDLGAGTAAATGDATRATRERCEKAADHLNRLVVATLVPRDAPAADRAYVERLTKQRRDAVVTFCLETSSAAEVDCMLAARDFPSLASCERHRRQIPPDLLERDYVTPEDCELFFLRLRQFKIAEGVSPAEIDETRDQLIRKCEDEARPGTLICFLAARTYEQARLCP